MTCQLASRSSIYLYERKSHAARSQFIMFFCLLLHRPGDGVAVILELDPACGSQPNHPFAGMVIGEELVCRTKVAGTVLSVVVMPRNHNLVSKGQQLASPAFQVFRGGGVRQPVLFHCFVDCHGLHPPCFFVFPFGVYIFALKPHNSKLILSIICTKISEGICVHYSCVWRWIVSMICSCQSISSKGFPAQVPLVWQRDSMNMTA